MRACVSLCLSVCIIVQMSRGANESCLEHKDVILRVTVTKIHTSTTYLNGVGIEEFVFFCTCGSEKHRQIFLYFPYL